MSKLSEYITLISRGLPNAPEIIKAISNEVKLKYNKLPEDEVEEITKRRIICATCPFNSTNAKNSEEYKELTGDHYKSLRGELHCSFCGCGINTRTASLNSECGISYWNEGKENKLEVKWKAYGKAEDNS